MNDGLTMRQLAKQRLAAGLPIEDSEDEKPRPVPRRDNIPAPTGVGWVKYNGLWHISGYDLTPGITVDVPSANGKVTRVIVGDIVAENNGGIIATFTKLRDTQLESAHLQGKATWRNYNGKRCICGLGLRPGQRIGIRTDYEMEVVTVGPLVQRIEDGLALYYSSSPGPRGSWPRGVWEEDLDFL